MPLTAILQYPAQICINKYAAIKLRGTTYETFTNSIATKNNEIISAGQLYDYNSAGHIAKFSAKGTPVWSYQYNLDFYDFVKAIFFKAVNFSDIIAMPDGGYIVAGNVEQVLSPFGLPPPVRKWALMSRLDRFGKVLWTKTIANDNNGDESFTNIYQAADGDIIAFLAVDNGEKHTAGDHSYSRVFRIAPDGQIRWSTFLFTYLFDAGGLGVNNKRAIVQAASNNIIIADVVHKTIATNGIIKEGNLHFFELDYANGSVNWETSYEYPVPASDALYLPDIVNAKKLSGGNFSFVTTLYLPAGNSLVKKGVNIITGNRGVIQNIIAYVPAGGDACSIKSAAVDKNNGNRTLLVDDDGKSMLMNIDDACQIVWQHGYTDGQGNFPVNCFSAGKSGYNIFTSNNHSLQYGLLITDADGVIDCANENADMPVQPAVLNYTHDSVVTDLQYHFDNYYDYAHPLKRNTEYPLIKTVDCQQTLACCTDFIDTVNVQDIHVCEGSTFMLPDSTNIKDSGLYDVIFKTALGCDSIRYYRLHLDKDVNALSLGNDTCIKDQHAIALKATAGFEKYYWMNNIEQAGNTFSIIQPGKYAVRVDNKCGTKTAGIEIFDECNYPLYMPTAFTPDNDKLNDYFRIAPTNKNKLVSFIIYDRWGRQIFHTTDPATGWDGTYKNEPASTGSYFYYIEMTGLSGKRITQKGYVILLR